MQRILVTGANRGLGFEFVRLFLARGDRVIAACRHPGRAQALTQQAAAHPGHLHVLPLDLARPASIVELAREAAMLFEGLDLLINNAGVLVAGERFGQLTADALQDSFRDNAVGPLLLTQALAPLLAQGEHAQVVNISSVMGSIARVSEFRSPSYAMSKAALNMATVQAAQALAPQGITVHALHPGWVRTDMGGPQAALDPAPAVAALLALIDASGPAQRGAFRGPDGETLPW